MRKSLFVLALLLAIGVWSAMVNPNFLSAINLENLIRRSSLFGILSLGAAFVILTGGIDLAIGSLVCLVGCTLPWLMLGTAPGADSAATAGLPAWLAIPAVLLLAALVGLWHGFLVVVVRLQPFVVTLCGLLLYRGLMRGLTGDRTMGLSGEQQDLRWLAQGGVPITESFSLPVPAIVLFVVAMLMAVFLHATVWGRHLLALGRNEEAARFSGVATGRLTMLAYMMCALLSGLGGLLFFLDVNSAQASQFGNFYELYAIAGAVLGGCALRGGECSVLGVVLGAAVMQVLQNAIRLGARSDQLEFAVVGAVILLGAAVDQIVRRWLAGRRRG